MSLHFRKYDITTLFLIFSISSFVLIPTIIIPRIFFLCVERLVPLGLSFFQKWSSISISIISSSSSTTSIISIMKGKPRGSKIGLSKLLHLGFFFFVVLSYLSGYGQQFLRMPNVISPTVTYDNNKIRVTYVRDLFYFFF